MVAGMAVWVLFVAVGWLSAQTTAEPKTVTVTGKLGQAMAIGGESSGWSIELEKELMVGGKAVKTLEVQGPKEKLEVLANKRVTAKGKIVMQHGVERGDWPVLKVSKIREATDEEKKGSY
jgi:hypothetical protein